MMNRPTKDEHFMEIARVTANRATCPRLSVGCVLVKDGIIVGTGYNGAPKGQKHCTEVHCLIVDNHCIRAVHAEMNACLHATSHGDITAYTTHFPCPTCANALIQIGVVRLITGDGYYNKHSDGFLFTAKVKIVEYIEGKFISYG